MSDTKHADVIKQAKGDELELKYMEDQREKGELNSRHMDDLPTAFSTGFEAGLKFALEENDCLCNLLAITYVLAKDGIILNVNSGHGEMVKDAIDQFDSFKESVE